MKIYTLNLLEEVRPEDYLDAQGIIAEDVSEEDAAHEAAIEALGVLTARIPVPFIVKGRVKRLEDVKKYLSELLVLEAALTETKDIFMRAIIEKPRELKNMKASVEGQLSSPAGEKLMSDPKLSDKILSGKALEEITTYLPDAMQKVSTPKQPMAKQPEAKKPQGRVL